MRLAGLVLAVCMMGSAHAADYSVLPTDKTVSGLYARWAKQINRKIIWDAVLSENNKIYSAEFDIINPEVINRRIKDHQDFKSAVSAVANYFGEAHRDVYTQVCLYEEGEIALWVHSSTILNCSEVYAANPGIED